MNLFDNQNYYNRDDYDKLSYDDQKELFLRIRSWVATVDYETRYLKDKYKKIIIKRIEQICAYACSGHIPAQDYMGYIYKRGFGDFFPINYKRAIEWNIIAASNGSKLAPQKMKTFMNPAVDMIILSPRWGQIIKFNDLNLTNYFWFLSQYVCEILYKELNLNPVEMSKKELIEEDTNENKTRIFFDRFRNKSVEQAIDILVKQLPEDMPENTDKGIGEGLLRDENGNRPGEEEDININIEDIGAGSVNYNSKAKKHTFEYNYGSFNDKKATQYNPNEDETNANFNFNPSGYYETTDDTATHSDDENDDSENGDDTDSDNIDN